MQSDQPRGAWSAGLALALVAGCAADVGGDDLSGSEQALYGTVTLLGSGPDACDLTQGSALMEALINGRQTALTPEFAATLRQELATTYLPCTGELNDPFATASAAERYERALAVMRGNATTTIGCRPNGPPGQTTMGSYGNPNEVIFVGREYLDGNIAGGMSDEELGGVAGILWHEALHQQGYWDCDSDGNGEGYSSSMPTRAQAAMVSAALRSRAVIIHDATRTVHSIPIGVSTGPAGDFGDVGDNRATTIRLGPAMRATVCSNPDGTGTCATFTNATAGAGWHTGLGNLAFAASYVRLEPLALAFSGVDYTGTVQAFGYGEFLGSGLGAVGDDNIRSIYVPAGMRVRACASAGSGHGSSCVVHDASSPQAALSGGVSYLDVVPVVTAFADSRFSAARVSMFPGTWSGSLGLGAVAGGVRSLVVPPGLTARLCNSSGCQVHTRSAFYTQSVPTRVEVEPVLSPRVLTVLRTGVTNVGTITTVPDGVTSCASTTCSATFHDRAYVRVRASSTSGYELTWLGCDLVWGDSCYVSMIAARSVTLRLDEPACSVSACVSACVAEGLRHAQCVPICRRDPCAF